MDFRADAAPAHRTLSWPWAGSIGRALHQDLCFTLRQLRRGPRFFVAVILIASVGVGAATAMTSLVQAVLLSPPPFRDVERLVSLWSTRSDDDRLGISLPDYLDWKREAQSYEQLALVHDWGFGISVPGGPPTMALAALVSGEYFPALGVQPMLGRLLSPEDDREDQPCRTVLAEHLFRTRFGSNPALLGQAIELDGRPCTVVGVALPGFSFIWPRYAPVSLWVSLRSIWPEYASRAQHARDEQEFHVLGKLRKAVTLEDASAELAGLAERVAAEHPGHRLGARLLSLHEETVNELRPRLWGLLAAIGVVFLAACSNIAGLFLVRAQARRREFALRSALGATRGRFVRQLMTELALIFAIASPGAWLLAHWFVALFTAIVTTGVRAPEVHVDGRVLALCLSLSSATGLLFGLGPALALSRVQLGPALAEAGAGALGSRGQSRMRAALVVAQVAAACALAASSTSAARAVSGLLRTPGGLDAAGIVTLRINPPLRTYPDDVLADLNGRLLSALRKRPGVISATSSTGMPMYSQSFEANFERVPLPATPREKPRLIGNVVPPGFFDALEIPLLVGRDFGAADDTRSQRVVIINEKLRSQYFPGEDPIGQLLQHDLGKLLSGQLPDNAAPAEIIGVVGDVRRFGLQVAPRAEAYFPFVQYRPRSVDLIVRFEPQRAAALAEQLPSWIRELEPRLPIWDVIHHGGDFEFSVRSESMLSRLLTSFAVACLGLAALGLYVAVSYTSAQRTREYALRAALGASPWNIVRQVTGAALRWVILGLALGLCAAWALGDTLSRQIVGARAFEPSSLLLAVSAVAVIAVLACAAPALRAARQVPSAALRRD